MGAGQWAGSQVSALTCLAPPAPAVVAVLVVPVSCVSHGGFEQVVAVF